MATVSSFYSFYVIKTLFIYFTHTQSYLHSTILCSIGPAWVPQLSVRYLRMYLVDSVLPAPDSPDTMIDWLILLTFMSRNALSAAIKKITSVLETAKCW